MTLDLSHLTVLQAVFGVIIAGATAIGILAGIAKYVYEPRLVGLVNGLIAAAFTARAAEVLKTEQAWQASIHDLGSRIQKIEEKMADAEKSRERSEGTLTRIEDEAARHTEMLKAVTEQVGRVTQAVSGLTELVGRLDERQKAAEKLAEVTTSSATRRRGR